LARAIKDIFPRYKTMKGFQVKRKAGWDTHGLPIELGVEKELGITKEDIGKTISLEEYNVACRKAVMRYTGIWNDLTQKMGYWVNMDDPYVTYEPKYMESVWWLLKQIYEKNLMYKGYTIQPYSPKAGTGLSSHELNQPGTYQDVTDTTVVAQFKAINETLPSFLQKQGAVYFLAWTTTPWTLPSNTALTVGSKIEYVLVDTFNQYTFEPTKVILAKKLVGKQFGGKNSFKVDTTEDFPDPSSPQIATTIPGIKIFCFLKKNLLNTLRIKFCMINIWCQKYALLLEPLSFLFNLIDNSNFLKKDVDS
jgi:isoleucyl-tRNA synthetase